MITHPMPAPARATSTVRQRVALAVAGCLALLVALLIANQRPGSDSSQPSPSLQGGSAPHANSTEVPPVAGHTVLTNAPAGVSWRMVGQLAVPVSDVDGPRRVQGDQAAGYSRTPTGALLAAAQIVTRAGYSAGAASWEPTLLHQFVPGEDRDRLLALLRDARAMGQPVAPAGVLAQIAGFRYVSYTADAATIGLVRRAPSTAYAMTTVTVLWHDDDWRMVAPPVGHWPALTTTVTDLTGIVAWGAG